MFTKTDISQFDSYFASLNNNYVMENVEPFNPWRSDVSWRMDPSIKYIEKHERKVEKTVIKKIKVEETQKPEIKPEPKKELVIREDHTLPVIMAIMLPDWQGSTI
jgi:hypothetical protein